MRTFGFVESNNITQQVYEFERNSFILSDEVVDGQTRLTYRTCYAPPVPYNLDFIINGRPVLIYKDVNPAAYGKFYTEHCQTFTGTWLEFELAPGDLLVVRYDYGEYGVVDTIYIKPE